MISWAAATAKIGDGMNTDTLKALSEIFHEAQKAGHEIWWVWGKGGPPEHSTGRAGDLMVRNEKAGDWVRDYIWANRARFGLQHVIWEQHITSTTWDPGVRTKMEDRGDPTANHYDHVHVLFNGSKFQAKPSAPANPPAQQPQFPPGPLVVDGIFGKQTIARWQKIMGVEVTGVIKPENDPLVRKVQIKLKNTVNQAQLVTGWGIKTDEETQTNAHLSQYLRQFGAVFNKRFSTINVKALQRRLNESQF